MERIRESDLEAIVRQINDATGSPVCPYTRTEGKPFEANVGNYHLDFAYGGVALDRMATKSGGVREILTRGTKRELYSKMKAFLAGMARVRVRID